MRNLAISLKRSGFALAATAFTVVMTATNLGFLAQQADAAQMLDRSLDLSSTLSGTTATGAANSATNGADTTHTFKFTISADADEIDFSYCTAAIGACVAPTGFAFSNGTSTASSLGGTFTVGTNPNENTATLTGLTLDQSTDATIELSLTHIKNPTFNAAAVNPEDNTFYVRMVTQATNVNVDEGTVASSVTQSINITAKVKETLGFSVTGEKAGVGDPATVGLNQPECAPLTGSGSIYLGDNTDHTLDFTQAYYNHSYFRIFTNASGGAAVQYQGDTLKKAGGVDIDSIVTGASNAGTEQFGLAMDVDNGDATPDNSDSSTAQPTFVNADTDWTTTGYLSPESGYDQGDPTNNTFSFAANTLTPIASSTGYLLCQTGAVRYVANISPDTPSGTYTTTLVYYAVPKY
jgi:hypothetical protein